MSIVQPQTRPKAGRPFDEAADEQPRGHRSPVEEESTPLRHRTALGDGIIDPRQTRTVLGLALTAVHSAPVAGTPAFAPSGCRFAPIRMLVGVAQVS